MLPRAIQKFIELFSSLPSIGPRQAHRLAFYIRSLRKEEIRSLADAVAALTEIHVCRDCFFSYEPEKSDAGLCPVCADPGRNKRIVALVEKETDYLSIEKAKNYTGRYLVLGELRKDGNLGATEKARLNAFKKQAKEIGGFEEIIIALNPTTFGDIAASVVAEEVRGLAGKITRLGRGMPTGGEIEFADEETLRGALEHRE